MKINSLQNISLNNKQRILDKNYRFFIQNSSDVFTKNQAISFKGKDDEDYITSDDNIEINEEYIKKLEDGTERKQCATIINITDDEFIRVNVQEVLKKAKEGRIQEEICSLECSKYKEVK